MRLMVQTCEVTTPTLTFKSVIDSYAHYIQDLPPEAVPTSARNVTRGNFYSLFILEVIPCYTTVP